MAEQKELEQCADFHIHEEIVEKVDADMPDEEILYDLAELFKIFGDSTRIKILYVLFESEMCVCDIAQLLGMTQSAISHQGAEAVEAGEVPPGGQAGLLRPGRRPRADHSGPGYRAHQRVRRMKRPLRILPHVIGY